jgi:Flp pilus assembly protein TadG
MRPGGERGQSTIELALCLPVVALVLAAAVEIALLGGDQLRLWHAAREAARTAVVDPDPAAVYAAVQRSGLEGVRVMVSPAAGHRVAGRPLTVTLAYGPAHGIPLLRNVLAPLTIEASTTMRIEVP